MNHFHFDKYLLLIPPHHSTSSLQIKYFNLIETSCKHLSIVITTCLLSIFIKFLSVLRTRGFYERRIFGNLLCLFLVQVTFKLTLENVLSGLENFTDYYVSKNIKELTPMI